MTRELKSFRRYAVPFTASDEEPIPTSGSLDVLSQDEYDYYYVRLRDLYRIAAAHFRTYPEYHDRVYELSVRTVLWADWRLFTQMMYDSPDLSLPLFDTADFCLLGGAVLSLTIAQQKDRVKNARSGFGAGVFGFYRVPSTIRLFY